MAPEESESRLRTRGWHRAQAQQHLEGSHGQAGGTREPLSGVANKGAPQKSFCPQHSAQQRAGPQLTGGSVRCFTEAGKHSHVQSVPSLVRTSDCSLHQQQTPGYGWGSAAVTPSRQDMLLPGRAEQPRGAGGTAWCWPGQAGAGPPTLGALSQPLPGTQPRLPPMPLCFPAHVPARALHS